MPAAATRSACRVELSKMTSRQLVAYLQAAQAVADARRHLGRTTERDAVSGLAREVAGANAGANVASRALDRSEGVEAFGR